MSILSLVPPLAVFVIGFLTRQVRLGLIVGILVGALMSTHFDLFSGVSLALHHFLHALELDQTSSYVDMFLNDRVSILLCLIFFGILTEIICESNAAEAFQRFSRSFVSDKRSAETSCVILSFILCIDDYLSAIVVGSVMRPLADRFSVARAKLAYLCNSLSSPMAAMIPFSSWSAAIVGILMEVGISEEAGPDTILLGSPYAVLLNMIPYMLYSIAVLTSVIFLVRGHISYSLMTTREKEAEKKAPPQDISKEEHAEASIWDFSIPIVTLLAGILLGLLYSGGFTLFGGINGFTSAILGAKISQSLLFATMAATLISLVYYIARGTFSFKDAPRLVTKGSQLMTSAILMLALTWTLTGLMKEELNTGAYIASLIGSWIPFALLPVIIFWLSSAAFFLMGSAWGTMAMLLPIVAPMIVAMNGFTGPVSIWDVPFLLSTMAAVVSGAVFGNHVSLISDTSLMASSSTNCDLLDHFKTKFVYALPVFIASSLGFLAAGLFPEAGAALPLLFAVGGSVGIMLGWQQVEKRAKIKSSNSGLIIQEKSE